jgi:hypothetical protein
MAGMALYQRSVLTVNNGKYYIDTTRSDAYQRKAPDLDPNGPRFVSVFGGTKTYYVFFLFAKATTKQIYQIYGGPNFTKDMVKGVRMSINKLPLTEVPDSNWTMPWDVKADPDQPGVLDVFVDFTKIDPKDGNLDPKKLSSDPTHLNETCHPSEYCTNSGGTCGCNTAKLGALGLLNPNYVNVCTKVCSTWAVRDIDCPETGCFGFKFTLPDGFTAQDQFVRPPPTVYEPQDWDPISLVQTKTSPDDASGGPDSCHYAQAQIPSDKPGSACPVRN